jgi:hypothetical protein
MASFGESAGTSFYQEITSGYFICLYFEGFA